MYDVVIIGAGIIGTAIARQLSKYEMSILVLEKENDVANGTTMANSAIVHSGYDPKPGTKKAEMNIKGNLMYPQICKELDVPFKPVGSLTIALSEEELEVLNDLEKRAEENGVPVQKLTREEVLEREPNISKKVKGALFAPSAGIVGPWELAIAFIENAMENGAELALNNKVEGIQKTDRGFEIKTNQGNYQSKIIINCAGIYADDMNAMIDGKTFSIRPKSGQYYVLDQNAGDLIHSIIFPCPAKKSKGVLAVPTVHGNILLGPTSDPIKDKEGIDTTREGLEYIRKQVDNLVQNIPYGAVIRSFTGLRATPDTGDFIIEASKSHKEFINVAGIESPGLSAAPAIAQEVEGMVKDYFKEIKPKKDFNPERRKVIHFNQLSIKEKKEIIAENPTFGNVICRCEKVTEGEIIDCIHRKAGATTVKGVKKRVRPGSGRCQGGFCEPRVVEILARELGKNMEEILYDGVHSRILKGHTKE